MIHEQLISLSEEIHKMDDSLNELRKKAISFLLQYVDNYEQVYFLSQLHSSKVVVDNQKVWKATADNAAYNMSSRLESIFSIKDIPCPVEKPKRFTEYIKQNIKRLGKTEMAKLETLCKTFFEIEEKSSFWEWPFVVDGFEKAISLVSLFMNMGGIFVFDMNTPYRFKNIYGDNSYIVRLILTKGENRYNDAKQIIDTLPYMYPYLLNGKGKEGNLISDYFLMTMNVWKRLLQHCLQLSLLGKCGCRLSI